MDLTAINRISTFCDSMHHYSILAPLYVPRLRHAASVLLTDMHTGSILLQKYYCTESAKFLFARHGLT